MKPEVPMVRRFHRRMQFAGVLWAFVLIASMGWGQNPSTRWRLTIEITHRGKEPVGELVLSFQHARVGTIFEAKTDKHGKVIVELPEGPYEVTIKRKDTVLGMRRIWVRPEPDRVIRWTMDIPPISTGLSDAARTTGETKEEAGNGTVTPTEVAEPAPILPQTTERESGGLPTKPVKTKPQKKENQATKELFEKPDELYQAGMIAAREGDYERAIEQWRRYLSMRPKDLTAMYNLGLALLKQDRCDEAVSYFEQVRQAHASWEKVLVAEVECLQRLERWEDAILLYEKLVLFKPTRAVYWFNLGVVAYRAGDLTKARQAWQKVIELSPDTPEGNLARQLLHRIPEDT